MSDGVEGRLSTPSSVLRSRTFYTSLKVPDRRTVEEGGEEEVGGGAHPPWRDPQAPSNIKYSLNNCVSGSLPKS